MPRPTTPNTQMRRRHAAHEPHIGRGAVAVAHMAPQGVNVRREMGRGSLHEAGVDTSVVVSTAVIVPPLRLWHGCSYCRWLGLQYHATLHTEWDAMCHSCRLWLFPQM